MSTPFQPARDRDAYAAIRGYVYQINRTLERWLGLESGQILELERGEDIDLVGRAMIAGRPEEESRLLEQVKHRDGNITLRSEEAIESLVNFHDHRTANPSADLHFCFLTNSSVGRERLHRFPNRSPGITLWEQLRLRQLQAALEVPATNAILQFLLTLSRPAGITQHTWDGWVAYLRGTNAAEFLEYIRRFEWNTAAEDAEGYTDVIRETIRTCGFGQSEAETSAVYERLFVRVASLLASPGLKQLTPEFLAQVVAEPTLAASDRELLRRLEGVSGRQTIRLEIVEGQLGELGEQFARMTSGNTIDAAFLPVLPVPEITPPPAVPRLSLRTATVEKLNSDLGAHCWLALQGGANSGKSQLAIQLASRHNCQLWIPFAQAHPHTAAKSFDSSISRLAGWQTVPDSPGWYADAAARLGNNMLLVFDDLPRLHESDPLAMRLNSFARVCGTQGVRLLSTSQYVLPARLVGELGEKLLIEQPAPPFTEDEAIELFRVFDAPDSILNGPAIGSLNKLAVGHPLLLVAVIGYLNDRNWIFSKTVISELLQGEHTTRLIPDIMSRLTGTLSDPQQQLLFRLTLPFSAFTTKEVTALAAVDPHLARTHETLNAILGSWVQRVASERMVVSPLVKSLGDTELSQDTRKACYAALAGVILRRKTANLREAEEAIRYQELAGEYDRAGTLYVMLLEATLRRPKADYLAEAIGRLWKDSDLPDGMSLGCRLMVRTYQLAAYCRHSVDVKYVVRDIDQLLEESTDREGWAMIALAVQGTVHYARRETGRVIGYIKRVLALTAFAGPDGKQLPFPDKYVIDLLWMVVGQLRTPQLLNQWIDATEVVPVAYQAKFWASDFARQGALLLGNSLYLAEYEKSVEDRTWESVLSQLRAALIRVQNLNQPRAEAAITMKILQVQADLKRVEQLAEDAEPVLKRWPNDPDVQFLVRGTWGRQCSYSGHHTLARSLLEAALSYQTGDAPQEQIRALLAASQSFGEVDAVAAVRYAEQARNLANLPDDQVGPLLGAQALGEYAVAVYLVRQGQTGAVEVFPAWSAAMKAILAIKCRDEFWQDTMVLFGLTTATFVQLARNGWAPEKTKDGEGWAQPIRGKFLTFREDRSALYHQRNEVSLMWIMSEYAEIGTASDREFWLTQATNRARDSSASYMVAMLALSRAPALLHAGLLEDAVEAAVLGGRGLQVSHALRPTRPDDIEGTGLDLEVEFRRLPLADRQRGDRHALFIGVLPAFFRIIPISFDDPAAAAEEGRRISAMCRQIGAEESGDAVFWEHAASLIDLASVEHMNPDILISQARGLDQTTFSDLLLLAYLLATWHDSLSNAFHYQLASIQQFDRCYQPTKSAYRLLMLPYFQRFWEEAIRERRAGFDFPPSQVAEAIRQAFEAPEAERVRVILRAASRGFRVREQAEARRWLQCNP